MLTFTAVILAFQAVQGYVNFVQDFDDGDYFESGAFLGGAVVDVTVFFYIIILAAELGANN